MSMITLDEIEVEEETRATLETQKEKDALARQVNDRRLQLSLTSPTRFGPSLRYLTRISISLGPRLRFFSLELKSVA
jgi:hypothetical protein